MSDRRSPLARARDEYLESDQGAAACEASTLGNYKPNYYLRNRLTSAFEAGAKAMEKIIAQKLAERKEGK